MLITNKARQEGFVLLDEVLTMWTGVDRACKCQKEWRERKTTMRDVSRASTLHGQTTPLLTCLNGTAMVNLSLIPTFDSLATIIDL